jgi:Bacterial membrane protein YfhO
MTLVVAGTGTYVCARVLRCSVLASAFAGTVFELSGAFMLFLGWPIASVFSWSGWLVAAVILIFRGEHRLRDGALFALFLACAVYAGQPDALVVLCLGLAVFVVALALGGRIGRTGAWPVRRPLADLALATVGGLALAAPLLLPGLQLIGHASRGVSAQALSGETPFPFSTLLGFFSSGVDGGVITGTAGYLGVLPVVLAVGAVVTRFRRPGVRALVVLAVVMAAIAFLHPVTSVLHALPSLGAVRWPRAVVLVSFPLAVLGAMGMDLVVGKALDRRARRVVGWTLGATAVVTLIVLLVHLGTSTPYSADERWHGIVWAIVGTAAGFGGIAVVSALVTNLGDREGTTVRRTARGVGVLWLVVATTFLVSSGETLFASSSVFSPVTPAATALGRVVGSAMVGLGAPTTSGDRNSECFYPPGLGIHPNYNILVGVHELAVYDPMLPATYYSSWHRLTGQPALQSGVPAASTFCPPITSAAIARVYGVSYVLEAHGAPGPTGAAFVETIAGEDLYHVPSSGGATLQPLGGARQHGPETVVPVTDEGTGSWRLTTDSGTASLLRLRLTSVPGWHATIDGRPLELSMYLGVMLQARIPPGRHVIELHYWPTTFTIGLALALLAVLAFAALVVARLLSRRSRS